MYLEESLKKFENKKIKIFVDMDGVIADYDVGKPSDFESKRPLVTSIEKLKEISKLDNIELYVLSITKYSKGIEEKNNWLDKYASFFKRENRIIISKEDNEIKESQILKSNYLSSIKRDESILILIDDDPRILHEVKNSNPDIYLFKDTVLVD